MSDHKSSRRAWVYHPFFFGAFIPLSLLSTSLPWASPADVVLPIGITSTLAIALAIVLRPLLPTPEKRGLAITLGWIPFYGYSAVVDGLRNSLDFREMLGPLQIAGAMGVVLLLGIGLLYALRKSTATFKTTTKALNRFSLILMVVVATTSCLAYMRQTGRSDHNAMPVSVSERPESTLESLPNIYVILCDAYPRSDYLLEYFDYDNTPFLDGLRDRGFYVAERSRSNYPNTLPSVASLMNMAYLDNDLATEGWDGNYPELFSQVRENGVMNILMDQGYEHVAIASGLFPTEMKDADRFIRPEVSPYSELEQRLIDMTPIRSIMNRMKKERWHHRAPFVLDTLEAIRREDDRPMLVFAHILAPHLPHSYDAEGNVLETFPPYKEGWQEVTKFLNTRLSEVVDRIQKNEPNSVILIFGDHGPNTSWQNAITMEKIPWTGTWEAYARDRLANLCALYLPDREYEDLLYPELTPVNIFRILFNTYLGAEYPILEDISYLSPQGSSEIVRIDELK